MRSTGISIIVLHVILIHGVNAEGEIQPCAQVQTSSTVVPMGSTVTATCVMREDCPLASEQSVHLEWRLGDRFIPSSPVANESGRVSRVVIPSFNHSRAFVTCSLKASPPQVIAGVEIRAGYPPEIPHNLSCQTNLSTSVTLTCRWDPGLLETQLMTKYTLCTEIRDSNRNYSYELPAGIHHFTIPRPDIGLFSKMKILVKAVNELGEATSAFVELEPVSVAKFDPPKIESIEVIPKKYGCLRLRWCLHKLQEWMRFFRLNLEIRLQTVDSLRWSEPIPINRVRPLTPVDQCKLLHGIQYLAQIRVRYKESPWSEWSSSQSRVTLERAPTGRLDWWMKVYRDPKEVDVQLFWKPSKQFCANGQNVSFIVAVQKQVPSVTQRVCTTRENYCVFKLPQGRKRLYLSAVNAAGKSSPTAIHIHRTKDLTALSDVTAVPKNDSLLIQWRRVVTPALTGYVVEWRPLLKTHASYIKFEIADKNQTLLLLPGSLEPYKPYGIAVYPRFKDGIGLPLTVKAYLSQKAPAMVPEIQIRKTWGSQIELTWDEIPLSQRNGIILSYDIFYWNAKRHMKRLRAGPEERKLTITDLSAHSRYKAFMMVSTSGGSVNGSTIHFQIDPYDTVTIETILILVCIGLSLTILTALLICFWKHKRLKREFWPQVPDPANSSIKKWTSDSMQDIPLPCTDEKQNPIYLSHLSFLDLPLKLKKEDPWMSSAEDTSDLGESICGSPVIPGYSGSNSESVPYATIIFPTPSSSPPHRNPQVYLRSESTQPLLEAEDSYTPKCYQNLPADGMPGEQCFFGPGHDSGPENGTGSVNLWEDFPFLRALAMNDNLNE